MKKTLTFILAALAAICLTAAFASCETSGHEHIYGEWFTATPATCTEPGTERRNCGCGHFETRETEALGHTPVDEVEVAATCTEPGIAAGTTCSVCGTVIEGRHEIQPLGHKYGKPLYYGNDTHISVCENDPSHTLEEQCEYSTETVLPGCETRGYHIHTCTGCGNTFHDEYTDALGHDWDEYEFDAETGHHTRVCKRDPEHTEREECTFSPVRTVEATCMAGGYTVYACEECHGEKGMDVTQPLEHQWSAWTPSGERTHKRTCSVGEGHEEEVECTFDSVVTSPTCDDDGFTKHTCGDCGNSYTDGHVDATGHDWGEYEYIGTEESDVHVRYCRHNHEHKQEEPCEMILVTDLEDTCVQGGTDTYACKYCYHEKGVEGRPLGHTWGPYTDNGNGTHSRSCEICGTLSGDEPCNYSIETDNATCLTPQYIHKTCDDCGYTVTEEGEPALGHDWEEWTGDGDTHSRVCKRDATHNIVEEAHTYGDTNFCEECGRDGLVYELHGPYYVVKDDSKIGSAKNITIASHYEGFEVKGLYSYAFMNNSHITKVTIPSTVTEIAQYAFYYCVNLETVEFDGESTLEKIGPAAFQLAYKLSAFTLPDTLVSIGEYAFNNCRQLNDINLPEHRVEIGSYAFDGCGFTENDENWEDDGLYLGSHLIKVRESITGRYAIVDGTLSVGTGAFADAKGLTEVEIPSSLTYFDSNAFAGCTSLETVEFKGTLAQWLNITFKNDLASPMHFASALHIAGAEGAIDIPHGVTAIPAGTFRNTAITSVHIPDTVTYIGAHAFEGCTQLSTINLPDSIREIGEDAFKGSYFDNKANWQDGILYIDNHLIAADADKINGRVEVKPGTRTIGYNAFKGMTALTEIVIPETVVFIGAHAFEGCTGLVSATMGTTSDWFAINAGGAGRVLHSSILADTREAARALRINTGYWKHQYFK